jgi:hypothetical protein
MVRTGATPARTTPKPVTTPATGMSIWIPARKFPAKGCSRVPEVESLYLAVVKQAWLRQTFDVHGLLHWPQWLPSVRRLASQPLSGEPSQLSQGASQAWPQLPVVHVGEALAQSSGQALSQRPQWLRSVFESVSQPSRLTFSSALQSRRPVEHEAMRQAPPMQLGVPLLALQANPQPPQLPMSICRLVHSPLGHVVIGATQLQMVPEQDCPFGQVVGVGRSHDPALHVPAGWKMLPEHEGVPQGSWL